MKNNFEKELLIKKVAILIILVTFASFVILTFSQPLKYSASSNIYIISNDQTPAVLATEKLSDFVYTSDFFYKALDTGFDISLDMFSEDNAERQRQWEKTIDIDINERNDSISVAAFHESKYKATELSNAVSYALALHGPKIVEQDIRIDIVDNARASMFPVKTDIIRNALIGLVIGMIVSAVYIQLTIDRPKKKQQKKEYKKKKKTKKEIKKKTVKEMPIKEAEEKKEEELKVGEMIEKEIVEDSFEPTHKEMFNVADYETFPDEEIEVMPRKYLLEIQKTLENESEQSEENEVEKS